MAILLGIPALIAQVDQLIQAAPDLVDRAGGWLSGLRERILLADVPGLDEDVIPDLRELDPAQVVLLSTTDNVTSSPSTAPMASSR